MNQTLCSREEIVVTHLSKVRCCLVLSSTITISLLFAFSVKSIHYKVLSCAVVNSCTNQNQSNTYTSFEALKLKLGKQIVYVYHVPFQFRPAKCELYNWDVLLFFLLLELRPCVTEPQ